MRSIGNATIEKVEEINGPGFAAKRMFPRFDQQAFDAQKRWMNPEHVAGDNDKLVMSIHTWIVKTPRHTILIDTCLGNHKQRANPGWNNLDTPFLERLKACGCPAESVDFVMCTHLHVDHVGWNTRLENGRWVPTFPNAKYLFAKREYAHWEIERKTHDAAAVNGGSFDDSVLPVVEAGKAVMIDNHQGLSRPHARLDRHQPQGRRPASHVLGRHHASPDPGLPSGLVEPVLLGPGHVGALAPQAPGGLRREQRAAVPCSFRRRQRGSCEATGGCLPHRVGPVAARRRGKR